MFNNGQRLLAIKRLYEEDSMVYMTKIYRDTHLPPMFCYAFTFGVGDIFFTSLISMKGELLATINGSTTASYPMTDGSLDSKIFTAIFGDGKDQDQEESNA